MTVSRGAIGGLRKWVKRPTVLKEYECQALLMYLAKNKHLLKEMLPHMEAITDGRSLGYMDVCYFKSYVGQIYPPINVAEIESIFKEFIRMKGHYTPKIDYIQGIRLQTLLESQNPSSALELIDSIKADKQLLSPFSFRSAIKTYLALKSEEETKELLEQYISCNKIKDKYNLIVAPEFFSACLKFNFHEMAMKFLEGLRSISPTGKLDLFPPDPYYDQYLCEISNKSLKFKINPTQYTALTYPVSSSLLLMFIQNQNERGIGYMYTIIANNPYLNTIYSRYLFSYWYGETEKVAELESLTNDADHSKYDDIPSEEFEDIQLKLLKDNKINLLKRLAYRRMRKAPIGDFLSAIIVDIKAIETMDAPKDNNFLPWIFLKMDHKALLNNKSKFTSHDWQYLLQLLPYFSKDIQRSNEAKSNFSLAFDSLLFDNLIDENIYCQVYKYIHDTSLLEIPDLQSEFVHAFYGSTDQFKIFLSNLPKKKDKSQKFIKFLQNYQHMLPAAKLEVLLDQDASSPTLENYAKEIAQDVRYLKSERIKEALMKLK